MSSLISSAALAQQPTPPGQQLAAAMQQVLVEAIARSEKSVVAIARVRAGSEATAGVRRLRDPSGIVLGQLPSVDPTHPDFIPHRFGTGVIIDHNGLILTQYHLLGEHDTHWVTTAERQVYQATVKAADPRSGLAILSVPADNLVPIRLGDAAQLRKGQLVIALGNPYAIARDGQASASWGIVANLARKAGPVALEESWSEKPTLHHFGTLIQTDAKLNLGTSGGALVNLQGEMVGLTTTTAAIAGYEHAAGYAVPVDETFRRVIEILKDGKEVEYGLLGVRPENLRPSDRQKGAVGILVRDTIAGTPAARAGLQPLDVITHVNDRPMYDADSLVLEVGRRFAGTSVRLAVKRRQRRIQLSVALAKYPVSGKAIVTNPRPSWRGMRIDYVTAAPPAEYEQFIRQGQLDLKGCVRVTEVEEQSPVWLEGIRANMFLSHVENRRVSTPQEFFNAVEGRSGPVRLRVTVPADQRPDRTVPPDAG